MFDRRRFLALVGTASATALSGCTFFGDDSDSTGSGEETGTPSSEAELPEQLPPGVHEDHVQPSVLADAHDEALRSDSFILDYRTLTVDGDRSRLLVEASGGRKLVTRTGASRPDRTTFVESTRAITRTKRGEEVSYDNTSPPSTSALLKSELIRAVLEAGQYVPVGTPDAFDTRVILERTGPGEAGTERIRQYAGLEAVESVEAELEVDTDGRVRNLVATVDGERGGSTEARRYRLSVERVGDTVVEEPTWLDEAEQRAVAVDIKMSDNARAVYILHENGPPLPEGTALHVYGESGHEYTAILSEEVAERSVMYLTFHGRAARLSVDEPPSERGDPLGEAYIIEAESPNGETLFRSVADRRA